MCVFVILCTWNDPTCMGEQLSFFSIYINFEQKQPADCKGHVIANNGNLIV